MERRWRHLTTSTPERYLRAFTEIATALVRIGTTSARGSSDALPLRRRLFLVLISAHQRFSQVAMGRRECLPATLPSHRRRRTERKILYL